jgi:hypothetical protein
MTPPVFSSVFQEIMTGTISMQLLLHIRYEIHPCIRLPILSSASCTHRYDGLQGFNRLFRSNASASLSVHPSPPSFLQMLKTFLFESSVQTERVDDIHLHGYTPLQNASYWSLPMARNINFVAIDRMLKEKRAGGDSLLDCRQQTYFKRAALRFVFILFD